MLRARCLFALRATALGAMLVAAPARAQTTALPETISEMTLPGGIDRALAAIGDRLPAERAQFLLETIRRAYDTPIVTKDGPRDQLLRTLLTHLQGRAGMPGDTLPLPLSPRIWTDIIFAGRVEERALVGAILASRDASLLYSGLLALDDETRAWLATQPELIREIHARHAAPFLVAAPGLRISGGAMRLPGGDAASASWEALVARRAADPVEFVRAVLANGEGRLPYFLGAMAQLTAPQVRAAFGLERGDAGSRGASARRLLGIFTRIAPRWNPENQVFWRPPLDPTMLIGELRTDTSGRPVVPGSQRFWAAVFGDQDARRAASGSSATQPSEEPIDIASLCEQVFQESLLEQRRRLNTVLFASRVLGDAAAASSQDAIDTARAVGAYPALAAVLERAKLTDIAAFAAVVRRAKQISSLDGGPRASRALAQFQGALAFVTRATARGGISQDSLPSVVSSIAAIGLSAQGEYEGRVARWLAEQLKPSLDGPQRPAVARDGQEAHAAMQEAAAGPYELAMMRMLVGVAPAKPRFVEWEGTRYRLDFSFAEAARFPRLLGRNPRPYLSSAVALVDIADAAAAGTLTADALRAQTDTIARLAPIVQDDTREEAPPERSREAVAALQRAARDGDVRAVSRQLPVLRALADDLLAQGLMEMAYAVAMGHPERGTITAADAARRHDFGIRFAGAGRPEPWQLPAHGAESRRGWHVSGSILGLDAKLADFLLRPLSSKPPLMRPSLNDEDRRTFIEMAGLADPLALTDADRATILEAIAQGRARMASVKTAADAAALAGDLPTGPVRRTLLPWVAARDAGRLATFLSPAELFWLGLGAQRPTASLDAWGMPAEPRNGCLCVQLAAPHSLGRLVGRWHAGYLASVFPDLNLRLSELLADLKMPAPLLAPVLAAAALDFINNATSRDQDDRRGLVDYVQGLRIDRLELYLALLTTDGPLVPVGEATAPPGADTRTPEKRP